MSLYYMCIHTRVCMYVPTSRLSVNYLLIVCGQCFPLHTSTNHKLFEGKTVLNRNLQPLSQNLWH